MPINSRFLLSLTLLVSGLLFGSQAVAQLAADPKAIDLTNKLILLDSSLGLEQSFNIGDINDDQGDDLLVSTLLTDSESHSHVEYYRAVVHSSSMLVHQATDLRTLTWTWDVDGDGLRDAVYSRDDSTGRAFFVRKGEATAEGFAAPVLFFDSKITSITPLMMEDVNRDHIPDMLASDSRSNSIYLYLGHPGSLTFSVPDDTITFLEDGPYAYLLSAAVGTFTSTGVRSLVCVTSQHIREPFTWLVKATAIPLTSGTKAFGEPYVPFLDTVPNQPFFIYTAPTSVGDITGDGLDDLLIGDSAHVYVVAGGSSFSEKIHTNQTADATIVSPALIDSSLHTATETITSFEVVPNLTGEHIPYLALTTINFMTAGGATVYFYAGGPALDSRYDGEILPPKGGEFLRLRTEDGRDALAFLTQEANSRKLELLHDGAELLPHEKASVSSESAVSQIARISSDGQILQIDLAEPLHDEATLEVYSMRGEKYYSTSLPVSSSLIHRIVLPMLPTGSYAVRVIGVGDSATTAIIQIVR